MLRTAEACRALGATIAEDRPRALDHLGFQVGVGRRQLRRAAGHARLQLGVQALGLGVQLRIFERHRRLPAFGHVRAQRAAASA